MDERRADANAVTQRDARFFGHVLEGAITAIAGRVEAGASVSERRYSSPEQRQFFEVGSQGRLRR
jgi:hypothetical protein